MREHTRVTISQYKDSPVLSSILASINDYLDPSADLRNFYNTVWNVTTASGYGLDVWGRIVGVSRYITLSNLGGYFGFYGTGCEPFGAGVFFSGGAVSGPAQVALTDEAFRQLILLKARANVTNGSASSINAILSALYGARGRCYVIDSGSMTFIYRFVFYLTPVDEAILTQTGVLPRPAGTSFTIIQGF